VLTARLDTQQIGYDEARSEAFYRELDRRIRALPGVESTSLSFTIPLSYIAGGYVAHAEGDAGATGEPRPAIGCNTVTPGYFETLRIPIVRGRGFDDRDAKDAPRVAIVNQTLAARFWPNQDPLGKRIEIPVIGGLPWLVVGVAADSKYLALFEPALPYFYLPQAQNPSLMRALQIRSSAPPADLRARVRREIEALEPGLPIADFKTLREVLEGNIGFVLFSVGALQATAMSVLGLVLAVVGVYGLVSFRTAQRSREIGIRMALGAVPADVRRLVLRQGAALVLAGIAIGLVLTGLLASMLTKVLLVGASDPAAFALATALLTASAFTACYLPARRAMRVEPIAALRHE
jgi:putative ABC transport system permease protein